MVVGVIAQWMALLSIVAGILAIVYFIYTGPSLRRGFVMGLGAAAGAIWGGAFLFPTAAAVGQLQSVVEVGVATPTPAFMQIHTGFSFLAVMMFLFGIGVLLCSVLFMGFSVVRRGTGGGAPGAGCTIRGRITANGVPLPRTANPRVTEVGSGRRYECNDQSRYEMTNLNPLTYQITAEADGFVGERRTINFSWGSLNTFRIWSWNRREENFDLVRSPAIPSTIQIHVDRAGANVNQEVNLRAVVMRSGAPVAGANLEFTTHAAPHPNDVLFNTVRGNLRLSTGANGEVSVRVTSRVAQNITIRVAGAGTHDDQSLNFVDPGVFQIVNINRVPNPVNEGDPITITVEVNPALGAGEEVEALIVGPGRFQAHPRAPLRPNGARTNFSVRLETTDYPDGAYVVTVWATRQGVARTAQETFDVRLTPPHI